jgi:hypothetical protein
MYKEHYFDDKRICFSHEFIGNLWYLLGINKKNKSWEDLIN